MEDIVDDCIPPFTTSNCGCPHILVVDDDQFIRIFLEHILT